MIGLDRRQLLQAGALGAISLAIPSSSPAADKPADKGPPFRLGTVTYNVAAAWDLPTLLRVCKTAGISPIEFRTTHKHGVEPTLSKEQRTEVKKRCADAGIEIWGCGSVCEFQAPDQA